MIFKRILLKLSGESLAAEKGYGMTKAVCPNMLSDSRNCSCRCADRHRDRRWQYFQGIGWCCQRFRPGAGDQMGMLATVINALAVHSALQMQVFSHACLLPYAWNP